MPKVSPTPGDPILMFWAIPRLVSNGGTPASERLRKHPYVYWLCKFRENFPNPNSQGASSDLPTNPSDIAGLPIPQRIAIRIREHAQEQIALGADPKDLAFFIQNFGAASGSNAGITPAIFRGQDDAVGVADDSRNYNAVYCDKSLNGPLAVQPDRVPCLTASVNYRDALKAELIAHGIGPLGWWHGDTEELHEPWNWCRSAGGGTWAANVADARADTEEIVLSAHRIVDPGGPNLTFSDMIAEAVARTPTFSVNPDISYSDSSHVSSGTTNELMNLRRDISQSQYARYTADVWHQDKFWEDLIVDNYEMQGNADRRFPMARSASGWEYIDHNAAYFGLDGHSPNCYNSTDNPGGVPTPRPSHARMVPRQRIGPGRFYDEQQMFHVLRRALYSCSKGPLGHLPISPWLRGCDFYPFDAGATVTVIPEDMVKCIRMCRQYPQCLHLIMWMNDTDIATPNWEAHEQAILMAYPQWKWNQSLNDWENVS